MRRRFLVSIDVERDIPMFLDESYEALQGNFLEMLETIRSCGFIADLFVEKRVVRKHPDLLRVAKNKGHYIAYHGDHLEPRFATQLSMEELESRLRLGAATLRTALGTPPHAFREANFAVDARVYKALFRSGFHVDSSVLPNRLVKRWFGRALVDHRGRPNRPYRIPLESGEEAPCLLEVPVSENPLNPGNPIGAGFLNLRGVEDTWRALCGSTADPLTFLIHPWECIDLGATHPSLPSWVKRISRYNLPELKEILARAVDQFESTSLPEVALEQGVPLR